MTLFKIDLKISVIYKTIKIEIPIKGNQNTHKGETRAPTKGEQTSQMGQQKTLRKRDNKNKRHHKTLTMKRRRKRWGCHQRKKMATSLNNTHTREDQREKREKEELWLTRSHEILNLKKK